MANDFKFDVFLSHSSKDKLVVRELAERLKKDGVRVWLDDERIKPGDSIPAKIEEGLEDSRVLVLCMSANAFGSDWAQLEIGTFRFRDPLNKERRFIPVRLDDAPIKGSLAQFLYIDWRAADREQEYAKLLEACREPETWPQSPESAGLPKQPEAVSANPPISSEHHHFGKHRLELAEETLALFYQTKDIIESARSPFYLSGECASRKAAPNESPEQKRIRDDAFVVLDRLNRKSETLNRLQTLQYRFMAQFGAGAVAPFDELRSILNQLFVSAHQWVMLSEVNEHSFTNPESLKKHRERIENYDEDLWGADTDDPISHRLTKTIEAIEQLCHPHLGPSNLPKLAHIEHSGSDHSIKLEVTASLALENIDTRHGLLTIKALNSGSKVARIRRVAVVLKPEPMKGSTLVPVSAELNIGQKQAVVKIEGDEDMHEWQQVLTSKPNFKVHEKEGERYGKGYIELTSGKKVEFEFLLLPDSAWDLLSVPIAPTFDGKAGHKCSHCGLIFLTQANVMTVTCPKCKGVDHLKPRPDASATL